MALPLGIDAHGDLNRSGADRTRFADLLISRIHHDIRTCHLIQAPRGEDRQLLVQGRHHRRDYGRRETVRAQLFREPAYLFVQLPRIVALSMSDPVRRALVLRCLKMFRYVSFKPTCTAFCIRCSTSAVLSSNTRSRLRHYHCNSWSSLCSF